MAQHDLDTARRLIDQRQFRKARALLETIDSIEADELLAQLDLLEEGQQRSLLRQPYGLFVLLGALIPLMLVIGAFVLTGGLDQPAVVMALPTPLPTLHLPPTQAPSRTPPPTNTRQPSPTATATPTTDLPPTWTATDRVITITPDTTGTALAAFVATGQALVDVTGTLAARSNSLRTRGTQVLGVAGTPDAACVADSRTWWRSARLVAADTFFNLADDQDAMVALVLEQPGAYAGLVGSLRVEFLESLRQEAVLVAYPPCAHTAREMLLAHMQQRISALRAIAAADRPGYERGVEQAGVYMDFFERELTILNVPRN